MLRGVRVQLPRFVHGIHRRSKAKQCFGCVLVQLRRLALGIEHLASHVPSVSSRLPRRGFRF